MNKNIKFIKKNIFCRPKTVYVNTDFKPLDNMKYKTNGLKKNKPFIDINSAIEATRANREDKIIICNTKYYPGKILSDLEKLPDLKDFLKKYKVFSYKNE